MQYMIYDTYLRVIIYLPRLFFETKNNFCPRYFDLWYSLRMTEIKDECGQTRMLQVDICVNVSSKRQKIWVRISSVRSMLSSEWRK